MGAWRYLLATGLIGSGLIIAWPWVRAKIRLDSAPAQIIDVLVRDLGDGNGQIQVFYAWTQDLGSERISHAGTRLGSGRLRPITDPIRPLEEADALARDLRETDRRRHRVFIDRSDPGTSFLVTPLISGDIRRYDFGMLLVVAGLVALIARRPGHG